MEIVGVTSQMKGKDFVLVKTGYCGSHKHLFLQTFVIHLAVWIAHIIESGANAHQDVDESEDRC